MAYYDKKCFKVLKTEYLIINGTLLGAFTTTPEPTGQWLGNGNTMS